MKIFNPVVAVLHVRTTFPKKEMHVVVIMTERVLSAREVLFGSC